MTKPDEHVWWRVGVAASAIIVCLFMAGILGWGFRTGYVCAYYEMKAGILELNMQERYHSEWEKVNGCMKLPFTPKKESKQ